MIRFENSLYNILSCSIFYNIQCFTIPSFIKTNPIAQKCVLSDQYNQSKKAINSGIDNPLLSDKI